MGVGDWLMCTAQVRQINVETKRKVMVLGRDGRHQWSEVFENNPRIARAGDRGAVKLINGGGVRPYIAAKSPTAWTWKRWDIAPGEVFLSPAEKAWAAPHAGHILIEPCTKVPGSNKAWLWERWQELADRNPGRCIQVGKPGTERLNGVQFVETPTFRHAMAVLAVSRAFVGAEGGLGHAAAALNIPAVILFSEFISPEFTGYPQHRNLRHAGGACGSRIPCEGCRESMRAITVDEVQTNLEEILL